MAAAKSPPVSGLPAASGSLTGSGLPPGLGSRADAMTNQTPSPPMEQDANPTLAAHSSLTHIIQALRDLVFNIARPKTEKAKTAKVPTDTLHL